VGQFSGGGTGGIGGEDFEHGDFEGEPKEFVDNAFGGSLLYPNFVVAVVFSDRAEVPAVDGFGCPGAAGSRFCVDEDASAGWGYWGAIQVESAA
jgi:hypothetical protein